MATVQAISLDIWGTLLRSDPAFKPARNELLRAALAPAVDAARFDATMRSADRAADEVCMTTGRDLDFADRVHLTLERLDRPRPDTATLTDLAAAQADLALAHPPLPLHPDLPPALDAIAARLPVVLTSNTGMLPGRLMRQLLQAAGFGGIDGVFSNEVGSAKPDRAIFDAALGLLRNRSSVETLGMPPACANVIHIGDNPVADVQGARAAGMQAALVEPDGHSTMNVLEAIG